MPVMLKLDRFPVILQSVVMQMIMGKHFRHRSMIDRLDLPEVISSEATNTCLAPCLGRVTPHSLC
jgi:hypothetical protein